jgi:uncharacterized Tic20 family protein
MTSQEGNMEDQGSKTQLERLLAALGHGSILLRLVPLNIIGGILVGLGGLLGIGVGIAVALSIWLVMKGKSDYVRGQALQAVVYQAAVVVVTMVWGYAWVLLLAGVLQIDLGSPPRWAGLPLFWIPIGFQVLAILYALWGAVRCLGGHDFRYAIVGKLVGRWI